MVRKRDQTGGSDKQRGRIAVEQDNLLPPCPYRESGRARRRRRARVAKYPPTLADRPLSGTGATEQVRAVF